MLIVALLAVSEGALYVHYVRGVTASQPCWNQLAQLEAANDQWAIENGATSGIPVTAKDISPYLKTGPMCHVANAEYIIGKIGAEPRCKVHGTISHYKPDRR
jgi:hypothetical protein